MFFLKKKLEFSWVSKYWKMTASNYIKFLREI